MLGAVACFSVFVWGAVAVAQDLNVALDNAQSRVESATAKVGELQAQLQPAQAQFAESSRKAAPVVKTARAANRRMQAIEGRLRSRHRAAAAKLARLEEEQQEAIDRRDETVKAGLGFGLAFLIAAIIVFAWDWFRASALVAWLTRMPRGQAIGLCVGGGLLLVIVGAALSEMEGAGGVIGVAVIGLGFVLAN